MGTLVLVRHGQSQWNAENRFTGWVDTPLSACGREEARAGGQRLAATGLRVQRAFSSALRRAVDTGRIVLDTLGQPEVEQEHAWQLNERFYGALTGRDKAQTAAEFGAEQVHVWRRSYDIAPPGGESLADTARRTLPYFSEVVLPAAAADTVLVSAHGNSLRAIVKTLDGLDDDAVTRLEIATGVPIVYTVDGGAVVDKTVLA
ncbi:MAG: 2,3-diphosphoglycerate-dependent phosphoglycerate mutase [Actinomycetota bacterium]|nr:2,3-diphosphoglycerate-dependent phosphoglycerate mutase [Actinomycetota bacterium]